MESNAVYTCQDKNSNSNYIKPFGIYINNKCCENASHHHVICIIVSSVFKYFISIIKISFCYSIADL